MDESCTDGGECSMKVVRERRVACAIRSPVDARDLQLECARVLHDKFLCMAVRQCYGSRKRDLGLD